MYLHLYLLMMSSANSGHGRAVLSRIWGDQVGEDPGGHPQRRDEHLPHSSERLCGSPAAQDQVLVLPGGLPHLHPDTPHGPAVLWILLHALRQECGGHFRRQLQREGHSHTCIHDDDDACMYVCMYIYTKDIHCLCMYE